MKSQDIIGSVTSRLRQELPQSTVEANYPLGAKTTYRVGGNVDICICLNSLEDAKKLPDILATLNMEILIFGAGSNMLISDSGFSGIAISLGETFSQIEIKGNEVLVGGGAFLPVVARQTAKAGLSGFEWAVGVPGSFGGAVYMNAGAHKKDMSEALIDVSLLNLKTAELKTFLSSQLEMSYRKTMLSKSESADNFIQGNQLVLNGRLALEPDEKGLANKKIKELVKWRRKNQPGGQNSGSVFKNPPDISAGELLETAGAKNLKINSANVSPKHANFIQAKPNGRAKDVYNLMCETKSKVLENSGVELEFETVLVNFK